MPAGRISGLVNTTILTFESAGRGLPCTAVWLTATLPCGSELLARGMVV